MGIVDYLYYWTNHALWIGMTILRVWALVDCLIRKGAAFPAVDKLTKPAWVAILLIAGFLGSYFSFPPTTGGVVNLIPLGSTIVASIYLADVRPAVREIADGR